MRAEASLSRMEHTTEPTWKRAVKCTISLLVFVGDMIRKPLAQVIGIRRGSKCVVLYYHSVPPSERGLFAAQLDSISRHVRVIRTADAASRPGESETGRDWAAITFDDGFENFLTQALPELEKRKLPATVFVIAEGMSREFGSDHAREKLLSLDQIRALPTELVSIGSHTSTHPMLTLLEEGESRREIEESRIKLQEMLGRPVNEFSFPFGDFNRRMVEFCRAAGYDRVYTTLPGFAFEGPNDFVVGRVRVDPIDWPIEFRLKLAGAYRWLPIAFKLKRRVAAASRRGRAKRRFAHQEPRSSVR
jgi:peptidoglycan/xylan/chitin deacetylase (PgdA/CDA1 family)